MRKHPASPRKNSDLCVRCTSTIAAAVGRDLSCICRFLKQKKKPKPSGRPPLLTKTQIDNACKVLEAMVDQADACYEITTAMVKKRARLKVCDRVLLEALHARGYWFRGMRKKIILTPEDVVQALMAGGMGFNWGQPPLDQARVHMRVCRWARECLACQ